MTVPDTASRGARRPLPHGGPARRRRVRHAGARRVRDGRPHRADLRAELLRCVHAELDRHPTPAVDPDALADALVPVARTPLGPLAADRSLRRSRARRTGSRSSTSSCRSRAATPPARTSGSATSSRCCAATCHPAIRSPPTRTGSHRFGPAAARLPHRQHRRRAAPARSRAVRGRRLQDELARADRARRPGAPARRALHPRAARRGDDRRALPAAGAALLRGAAPVPALAAGARATTRSATSAACSTCSCAGCAGRTARWSTTCPAGSSPGGRPRRS